MRSGLLAAGVVLLLASAALPRVTREMPDFEVYWRAGQRAAAAAPLYRPEDGHYQNKYLPVFAMAAVPLATLPLPAAKIVWFYLTVAAILALLALSYALLPARRVKPAVLLGLSLVAMLKFYAREVNLGQTNALMGVLVLAGLWFATRGQRARGGALFAASLAAKPYTVALLPYLAVTRRLTELAAFGGLLTGLLLAPALVYGFEGNADLLAAWVRTTSESTAPNLLNPDNVSVWAMYAKWLGPGQTASWLAAITIAALGSVFLVVVVKGTRGGSAAYLEVAALLLMLPVVSPQGWDYGLLIGTPAVMLLLNHFPELPRPWRVVAGASLATMSLTIYDILGRRLYAAFMATSLITMCVVGIVATLAVMRLRRIA